MKMPPGKIPPDILRRIVFKNLGINRPEVIMGPAAGIDGAVIDAGNRHLIVSMDPITGSVDQIGWLAVNINANDIATFGVEPAFLFSCILLPKNADEIIIEKICSQMDKAAKDLGVSITGGHCEVTPQLINPIVVGCMMGIAEKGKFVTANGSQAGDQIILTKSAGIEGTAILASDKENQLKKVLDTKTLKRAKAFYKRISIVEDALTAFNSGGVHAMHDPTEGGIAGAIHEMADASNCGVEILADKIAVEVETEQICKFYGLDPLQLIASGSLLISAEPESIEKILEALRNKGIQAQCIGQFLRNKNRIMIGKNGRKRKLVRPLTDQLWKAL